MDEGPSLRELCLLFEEWERGAEKVCFRYFLVVL